MLNLGTILARLGLTPASSRSVVPIPENILALVPAPADNNITVKGHDPDVERDTMPLIVAKAKRTAWQTKKLAARLKGPTLADTLQADSNFILKYIRYVPDDPNHEQVRSPRRLIYEAKGDCDCFAVTLATLLINQGINFRFRIAQYPSSKGQWSHIYIVVPKNQTSTKKSLSSRSEYVVLDPVTNLHDFEVDFVKKQDINMALQFLDGVPGRRLGACPSNSAPAQSANATATTAAAVAPASKPPIQLVTTQNLTDVGLKPTTSILESLGIPYQHKIDENNNPSVIAQTPSGSIELPTVMDDNNAALLNNLINTQAGQEVAKAVNAAKANPVKAIAAVSVLGLLAWWAFGGKPGKLGGPVRVTPRKLNVLHI